MSPAFAASAAQLAEALQFIHQCKVYHCDLKPSNVLLTPDGRPMLLDFNLCANALAAQERLGGTLPYMAPRSNWWLLAAAKRPAPSISTAGAICSHWV